MVNQFVRREETHHRHLSCATIQSRLSLYVPREPCECSPHLKLILHSCLFWKRVLQCSIELQESWEHGLPNDTQASSSLRSLIDWHIWRDTHRRAMSRGTARPPWLRTQTHVGESDCSTSPGNRRETFLGYLPDFRMLHINSYTALIFRAAIDNKYMEYNKHILILQYFIVENQ